MLNEQLLQAGTTATVPMPTAVVLAGVPLGEALFGFGVPTNVSLREAPLAAAVPAALADATEDDAVPPHSAPALDLADNLL